MNPSTICNKIWKYEQHPSGVERNRDTRLDGSYGVREAAPVSGAGGRAPKAGGLRAYNLDGGNFFATRASPLGVEWKPPRVVMMFALSGDKADGVASLECVKRLDGSLDFGFIGVDVFNENEDRLLVSGSVDRMTEKADKLRELSIRKYR